MFRTALLLAFDHDRNVEREFSGYRLECAARLDKRHRLALIVAGAARHDDFAPLFRCNARFERRRLPQIEWIDRLYVIMAIKQDPRPSIGAVAAFADPHRMAGGRAQTGVEAETAEIGRNMFRGLAALCGISGVRRDRLNAQQREQPVET